MELITTHINADFDTLASMLAVKKLYPKAHLVFPGSQEKGVRDFLLKSTLYIFEVERAKDIDLDKVTRLILVDIRQPSRIGRFAEIIGRPGLDIHIYDHHPPSPDDIHGSVEVTHPWGATTTILTLILKEKGIDITPEEATIMMLGIYEDTGSLQFPSTTIQDYEASSFLLSRGADLNIVSSMLTKELTVDEITLLNELIEGATTYTIGDVDVVIAEATSPRYTGDIAGLAHRLRDIRDINCLFVLVWMEDRVHIVARSRLKEVNVGEVCQAMGGGGHPTAASATLKDVTLIQARERLINILREKVAPRRLARDIMSSPAITIPSSSTIESAKETLTRYNINALPVIDGDTMVGVITRQVVEKALYHGLKDIPVRDYMTPDFETVSPTSPLQDVQEAILGHNQRLLPVMEGRKLGGVITRTDLLRALHEGLTERPYLERPKRHKVVAQLMEEHLPERVVTILKDIGRVADGLGYKAYAVGGFVRDLILRYENLDVDIVIEGDGIAFANEFARYTNSRTRTHPKFGTAVVIFPDGFKVDIATARLEYYERPGALPTVELSSIKLDLYRRDFTINTLAIVLNPDRFGEVLDFFGGQKDLKEKTIRVLHNLSFVEDPTRVFRCIRFGERFGFKIGKHTQGLIKNAVRLNLFQHVSGGRIMDELKAILEEENFLPALRRLKEFDLLKFIHPAIKLDRDEGLLLEKAKEVLTWYHLLYLGEKVEGWLILFLSLTDPLDNKGLLELIKRFNIPGKHRIQVIEAREEALNALGVLSYKRDARRSEVYSILRPLPMEDILYIMAKAKVESVRKTISLFITHLKDYKPILKGEDLKRLGIPQGPIYGELLNRLMEKRLNGEIKTREEEEAFVRDAIKKVSL